MNERREGRGDYKQNAAKIFLGQYRGLLQQYETYRELIAQAEERATDTAAKLSNVRVHSGRVSDTVAEAAAQAVDTVGLMMDAAARARTRLEEIMRAVESVPEEMQKAVLLKRYIAGESWQEICSEIGYEKTRVFELHGWGLAAVNKWMKKEQEQ